MSLGKLVGLVLGGACGLLALVAAALFAGMGSGVGPAPSADAESERPVPNVDAATSFGLAEESAYAIIAERPVFNETREPEVDEAEVVESGMVDPDDPTGSGEPPPPLEVQVKGIILAPDVRVAIVTDPASQETLRLREGMPLEGELAAWTLAEIQPRKLVFDGAGADQVEVELQVNTGALSGGPAVTNRTARTPPTEVGNEQQPSPTDEMDAQARAEEIRRRVAERRAQLREEAERRRAQQDNDGQ